MGRMLCLSREAGYIHEPFNPTRIPGWTAGRIPYWYLYVCSENERYYRSLIERVLEFRYPLGANLSSIRSVKQLGMLLADWPRSVVYRIASPRPLIKDPLALFSAEWLARSFDMQVVVMIRHPAAFASSLKHLNWQFKFRSWLAQDLLLRDWLAPFEQKMREHWTTNVDIIDQSILLWNAIHHVIREYRQRHPSWIFLRHEDVAGAPVEQFDRLYEELGLSWDERVRRKVASYSAAGNPSEVPSWRHQSVRRNSDAMKRAWMNRLSGEEIERVRSGVADVAKSFYDDSDWDP